MNQCQDPLQLVQLSKTAAGRAFNKIRPRHSVLDQSATDTSWVMEFAAKSGGEGKNVIENPLIAQNAQRTYMPPHLSAGSHTGFWAVVP